MNMCSKFPKKCTMYLNFFVKQEQKMLTIKFIILVKVIEKHFRFSGEARIREDSNVGRKNMVEQLFNALLIHQPKAQPKSININSN